MTLQEILKAKGLTDEAIEEAIGEMKQNKIFTTGEENMDIRYPKLKEQHDAFVKQHGESTKLIEELQKAAKGNETIQAKISEYESTIAQMNQELEHVKLESAIKVALLGAKADDVDYLTFKLKEKGELKLDDQGNIKGIEDMLAGLKTQFPGYFEASAEKKFEERRLLDEREEGRITKEEFSKMGDQGRTKLFIRSPFVYLKIFIKELQEFFH